MGHRVLDGEPVQQQTTREIEIKKFMTHGSQVLEKVQRTSQENTRGGQGRVQAEREVGPGAHAFIRVCGWMVLGFPGSGKSSQLKPKEQGFC